MKYYEYTIESNKIEFHNSYLGTETILVNGKKVSKKYSITGTEHPFKINGTKFMLTTEYELFQDRKFNLYLEQNGKLIDLKYIKLNKRYRLIVLGIGIVCGFWIITIYNTM